MGINFNFDSTAVRTSNQQRLQDDLDAAHGRIVAVLDRIAASPFADEYQKVAAVSECASTMEAFVNGQRTIPMPPRQTPAGIAPAPQSAAPDPATATVSPSANSADALRIAELEKALTDMAAQTGATVPTQAGKISVKDLLVNNQRAIDAKIKAAVPADSVKKADVLAKVDEAEAAAKALKTTMTLGSTISGKDDLLRKLAALRRAVS